MSAMELGGPTGPTGPTGPNTITVRENSGSDVGTRARLNFIEGSNVTLTVTDDAGNNEVDITIASSGSGGGNQFVHDFLFMGGG